MNKFHFPLSLQSLLRVEPSEGGVRGGGSPFLLAFSFEGFFTASRPPIFTVIFIDSSLNCA